LLEGLFAEYKHKLSEDSFLEGMTQGWTKRPPRGAAKAKFSGPAGGNFFFTTRLYHLTQTLVLTLTLEVGEEVRMPPSYFCPWGTQRQKRLICSSQFQFCYSVQRSHHWSGDDATWRSWNGPLCHFLSLFPNFDSTIPAPPLPLPLSGTDDSRHQSGTWASSGPRLPKTQQVGDI
jgi:hypothetical protein